MNTGADTIFVQQLSFMDAPHRKLLVWYKKHRTRTKQVNFPTLRKQRLIKTSSTREKSSKSNKNLDLKVPKESPFRPKKKKKYSVKPRKEQ